MGFGRIKIKTRVRTGRGSADADAIIEAVIGNWSNMQQAIDTLTQEEKDEMRKHFNESKIDSDGDLGDILFGSADDFDSRVKFLD